MSLKFNEVPIISATEIKERDRLNVRPHYFGAFMVSIESAIFECMGEISPDYNGGMWRFYVLSNGAFYMAPKLGGNMKIAVEGNCFEGLLSADAAGIAACLFIYSRMSFKPDTSHIGQQFHLLRDFALDHKEAAQIFAATDID